MKNKTKKKKTAWQDCIAMAFSVLIGIACGFLIALYLDRNFNGEKPVYMEILCAVGLFVGMYVAIFIQFILHEMGHLVFGLISGYQFSSFRIFSYMWLKEGETIRLKRLQIAGTGGQCLMSPPDMEDGRIPVILYNLGGVLMNIIFSIFFAGLYFVFAGVPFLSILMLIFSVVGFILAAMNGIPMRMGMVDNDGYNALSLSRHPEAMRAFWVQMKANEQTAKGIRLRSMPDEWFTVPSDEAMKNSLVAMVGVFACSRLIDAQRFEEADKLMAHMLENDEIAMVGLHRNMMIFDRMYLELIGENRKQLLDEMFTDELKKFMKAMKNFPSILRTEYAYALLCEKDLLKAEQIKRRFEKNAARYPYPSEVQSERELMELAEKKADFALQTCGGAGDA